MKSQMAITRGEMKPNPRRRADVPADFGWKGALRVADKLYEELAAEFQPGGVRMILRALRRRLDREGKGIDDRG